MQEVRSSMHFVRATSSLEQPVLKRFRVWGDCGFFGDFAFLRDLAEADVFELRPYQADGDYAEEGDDHEHRCTGHGGFRVYLEDFGKDGSDGKDLREPADHGKLKNASATADHHQDHGFREADASEGGTAREAAEREVVGTGNERPHGERCAGGDGKVRQAADGVESGLEAADLFADDSANVFRDEAEGFLHERGDGGSGDAHEDEEDDAEESEDESAELSDARAGKF